MSNPLRSEKYSVIQVHIRRIPIAERFTCMENERNMDAHFLLALHELSQWLDVIDEWFEGVLMTDEVEALQSKLPGYVSTWDK